MNESKAVESRSDYSDAYNKLMDSKVTLSGKSGATTFTMREVYKCASTNRQEEVRAFFYRVNVALFKGVWLENSKIEKLKLSDEAISHFNELKELKSKTTLTRREGKVINVFDKIIKGNGFKSLSNASGEESETEDFQQAVAKFQQVVENKEEEVLQQKEKDKKNLDDQVAGMTAPLTNYVADVTTQGSEVIQKALAKPILKKEIAPIIDTAMQNFNKFCLENMVSDNHGRRVFNNLSDKQKKDFKELYEIRTELTTVEGEKNSWRSAFFSSTYTAQLEGRIKELKEEEAKLVEKLKPVKVLLEKDVLNPLVPEMQRQVAKTLNNFYTSLADAQANVNSDHPHFENYPKNYKQFLMAEATSQVMKSSGIEGAELVHVPELSQKEKQMYSSYVDAKIQKQKLQRLINPHDQEGMKSINQELAENAAKLQKLQPQIDAIEKKLEAALVEGDKEAEKKFFENGLLTVMIDKILFPKKIQLSGLLGGVKDKLVKKELGMSPESYLKQLGAEQVLTGIVNKMSSPQQVSSVAGAFASSYATAIDKYNRRQGNLTEAHKALETIKAMLAKEENQLENLDKRTETLKSKVAEIEVKKSSADITATGRAQQMISEKEKKISTIEERVRADEQILAGLKEKLKAAKEELDAVQNPGLLSWGANLLLGTDTEAEGERLEQEVMNIESQVTSTENKIRTQNDEIRKLRNIPAPDIEKLKNQVLEELEKEIEPIKAEIAQIADGKQAVAAEMHKLKEQIDGVTSKIDKTNEKIRKLSYLVEREVTDEMVISSLIGPEAASGIKDDIKQLGASLLTIVAPTTASVLTPLAQVSGYDDMYAAQTEQYISVMLNQFAFQVDEKTLSEGYEQLLDTLNGTQKSDSIPPTAPQVTVDREKAREDLRQDLNKIVDFQMGATPGFVKDHAASSVNAMYDLFENPALNRVLICQLLGAMSHAVEEVDSKKVA